MVVGNLKGVKKKHVGEEEEKREVTSIAMEES